MLNTQLAELEQEFRKQWRGYQPQSYAKYLAQVEHDDQVLLLARLLSVELEFAYQPPNLVDETDDGLSEPDASQSVRKDDGDDDEDDDEDDRVKPRVMLFLHQFPQLSQHREQLIRLVMLEFALRLQFDPKTPNYDSYLDLCPQDKERIGGMMQVMEEKLHRRGSTGQEASVSCKDDTTVTEGHSQKSISLAQLPCSLGYFLVTDVIGKGGMGTVYGAVDLRSAAHVAVKIIHRTDGSSIFHFIEEFTWLSTLNHPNVVKLFDTFSEGDIRYFSMELVEGQSIHTWFQGISKTDRWSRLRRVLSQAALAVAFLHDHDVLHRDIKGSNLMITGKGRAVLLDLGLASRIRDEDSEFQPLEDKQVVGTLPYLAPEVLNGNRWTFASDWYSFGVMMYETITGKFPPMRVDQTEPVGSPDRFYLDVSVAETALADCPRDLASLSLAMLNPNPIERPIAADILPRLGSDVGQPIPLAVTDTDFLGREQGLAFLDAAWQRAAAGHTEIRLIRGVSGMGKTALLNRWLRKHLDASSSLRLNIRCHSHDHQPLRALNLVVQELVSTLSLRPLELWEDLSRGGSEEIVYTFPQIERLAGRYQVAHAKRDCQLDGRRRSSGGWSARASWLAQGIEPTHSHGDLHR